MALYVGRHLFIIHVFYKTEQATLFSQFFYQKMGNKITNYLSFASFAFKFEFKCVKRCTIFSYTAFTVWESDKSLSGSLSMTV